MKHKIIKSLIIPTTAVAAIVPFVTLGNQNKISSKPKSDRQSTKDIFNLKDGILYGFKDGVTQQDLLDNMKDNTLVLPECKEIADGAFRDTILNDAPFGTTISIPESTTSIGNFAFYGNTAAAVTWEGTTPSCTTIGKSAFARCKKITSFTLPSKITTIKADAFMGCSALTKIDCTALTQCPKSLGNKSIFRGTASSGSLIFSTSITDANIEDIWMKFVDSGLSSSWSQNNSSGPISKPKTIPADYLTYTTVNDNEGNATLTVTGVNTDLCDISKFNKLTIPASFNGVNVTKIGDSAFTGKTSLTNINLSSATNLTTIGASAFQECSGITTVSLHKNLTTINNKAFYKCTGLTTVSVPTGSQLTTIGISAFDQDAKLSTFAFQNTILNSTGNDCFRSTALTSVTMPNTLKVLGGGIFNGCTSLTKANLGNVTLTTTTSTTYLFYGCTKLTSVTLPNNITTLTAKDFNNCTSLASITIPASISSIAASTFSGCTALTSVTFSNSSNAFTVKNGSSTISSKYLPTGTKMNADYLRSKYSFEINPVTFTYSYLNVDNEYASTFTIPFSSTSSSITWTSSNTNVATVSNGKVTVKKGATGDATITATITSTTKSSTCTIYAKAHDSGLVYETTSDTEASVKDNTSSRSSGTVTICGVWNSRFVTSIPSLGFDHCVGTKYCIPGTLKTLNGNAFYNAFSTNEISFQEPCNFTIGSNVFNNADGLSTLTYPEGLTSLKGGKQMFRNANNITTVIMPSTLEEMTDGGWFLDGDWGKGDGSFLLDLTKLSHVPTAFTSSFGSKSGQTMKIKVKTSMLDAFSKATYWSTLYNKGWIKDNW